MRYRNRDSAGKELGRELARMGLGECVVLAIPNGGIPVGISIAEALGAPLGIELVRKLLLPGNTEGGFGATTSVGDILLNEELVEDLELDEPTIRRIRDVTLAEIRRRETEYGLSPPVLTGKTVILTDDGLASGFSMIAAARSVRKRRPSRVMVAVPTAPARSVSRVRDEVDGLVCPDIRDVYPFAVADAYDNWCDLTTGEGVAILRAWLQSRRGITNNP